MAKVNANLIGDFEPFSEERPCISDFHPTNFSRITAQVRYESTLELLDWLGRNFEDRALDGYCDANVYLGAEEYRHEVVQNTTRILRLRDFTVIKVISCGHYDNTT